jgi:hypothetical protein
MDRHELPNLYEVLQVSRRADPLIITKAYRLLATLYHPDNQTTADEDKFRQVVDAYRELVDPVRRAAYDRATFSDFGAGSPGTNGTGTGASEVELSASPPPQDERQLRRLVLQALYNMRRNRPYKPGLPLMVVAELLGASIEQSQFTLWYLRGKKLIEISDDDGITITIAGVDYLEAEEPQAAAEVPAPLPLPQHVVEIPIRSPNPDQDGIPSPP